MSCNKHAAPPLFTCLEVPVLDLESSELNSVNSITGTSGMATNSNPIAINLRESALDYTAIPSTSKASDGSKEFQQLKDTRIARATKQYVFDEHGVKYLDCFNGVAHVGHCHPQVVAAASTQMGRVATSQGFKSTLLQNYVKRLAQTLPESLDTVYVCNSGSEANDLALRLARQYTEEEDIVVTEDAFHGNLGILIDISPKMHGYVPNYKCKDFVHITPLPISYRHSNLLEVEQPPTGMTGDELDKWVASKCADKVDEAFVEAERKGRGIAAFICEPCFIVSGVCIPHKSYFERVYKTVHDHQALIIADETQTGLGRTGDHFWGFQRYGVIPDIVTVGRPLGAGHPIGAVITSNRISKRLGAYFSTFGGNPVSCAIGLAVLDVIKNENLMSSARNVGQMLQEQLNELKTKYPQWLGDIRGRGLVIGLEIVSDATTKAPNSPLAINIMYNLKAEKVLVGISGKHKNVIFISPPLCFTIENSRRLIYALDSVLASYKAMMIAEAEPEKFEVNDSMFNGCIATSIMSSNSRKRALNAATPRGCIENNSHLFAPESPMKPDNDNGEEGDSSPIIEEEWTHDAKKAREELEEYEDVD